MSYDYIISKYNINNIILFSILNYLNINILVHA